MSGADEERSASAGEYVLGTLDAAQRDAVERALATDPALRAEVAAWHDRLLPLAARVEPVAPSPVVWSAIERRITPPPLPDPTTDAMRTWRHRLRRWQWSTGLALATAVLLAFALLLQPGGRDAPVRYVAVLEPTEGRPGRWLVEVLAGAEVRLTPLQASIAVPADRAVQFWTKPRDAAGPTSLGLVPGDRATVLPVARLPAVEADTLFELTLEPDGGSPLDRPTGPILYVGRSTRL